MVRIVIPFFCNARSSSTIATLSAFVTEMPMAATSPWLPYCFSLSICPAGVPSLVSKTAVKPASFRLSSFSASCSPARQASQNGELPLVSRMMRFVPPLALVAVPKPDSSRDDEVLDDVCLGTLASHPTKQVAIRATSHQLEQQRERDLMLHLLGIG